MKLEMIFSDIDGTLINKDLQVTPKTQEAIKEKVAQGVYFVPVSARMPEAMKPIVDVMDFSYPIISYNGALIQDEKGQTISSNELDSQTAYQMCQYLEENWSDVAWNVYSYGDWMSQNRDNYWIHREEVVVGLDSRQVTKEEVEKLSGVHKLLLMGEPERMDELEPVLKEAYPELSIAKSLPYYIEVMAQGIEKGQAVEGLAQHYGVAKEHTIAFGDNYNDLPMLEVVGRGVAMGNAPEPIKKQVAHVTLDNNHDGIAVELASL